MATIRPATVQDAPAVGRLNVRVWQVAYGLPVRAACGQMPDERKPTGEDGETLELTLAPGAS